MRRYKKAKIKFMPKWLSDYFPVESDTLFKIFVKILFLFCVVALVSSSIYFLSYYYNSYKQRKIIENQRMLFGRNSISVGEGIMEKQNSDYEGWLKLGDTQLNNPVYKTDNNSFYLQHNALKNKSNYGSLFLDYRSDFKDNNTVIYGNNSRDGMMFASLENLRELSFYKANSIISLTYDGEKTDYRIYAVFVMNSSKKQDDGNIYSVYQSEFKNQISFDTWVSMAKGRSIINTEIDVKQDDKIITLITSCDDFEGARLVVMARSQRDGENLSNYNSNATMNPKPKYPKEWYKERNIDYPF